MRRRRLGLEAMEARRLLVSDLVPVAFGGWSAPLVVSVVEGTNTDATVITAADNVFVDAGWTNVGEGFQGTHAVEIYLDNTLVAGNGSIPDGSFAFIDIDLGTLSVGTHSLEIRVDANDEITEDNETNNSFSRTFEVVGAGTEDFGDAPTAAQSGFASSYPVTLADDGARHTPVSGFSLGVSPDTEPDGLPSAGAQSDDLAGVDDEDGVEVIGGLSAGNSGSIHVELNNTAALASPWLDAWIDFDQDGVWSESERIFGGGIVSGTNTISVNVPGGAGVGQTYARFRLHDGDSPLLPTGLADSGEVEDHSISLGSNGVWLPLGPSPARNGQTENVPLGEVAGAIHTVIAHPTNADVLFIGATNGGVWRTENATDTSPEWNPLTDDLPSLSIGALQFDIADPTFQTVVAGIGRFSSFARRGGARTGLIRTTDGGDNWDVLDGGGRLTGANVSGLAVDGDTIVVSVNVADQFNFSNIGIFRSTDGGSTFNQISVGDGSATGLPGGASYDLVRDPSDPDVLYTSTVFSDIVGGQNGFYKSTDAGATWNRVSNATIEALISNSTSNIEFATGANDTVYATIINSGNPEGIFQSTNGGSTWTQLDTPSTNEGGVDVGLNPRGQKGPGPGAAPAEIAGGQGSIHFSMVVDPQEPNRVFVGGDRQPRSNGDAGSFPNSIGARNFTGRLFRGDATASTGNQWVHLTHSNSLGPAGGGTASSSSPHADSREMVFDANGDLIEVDDGGIYRRTQPSSNAGDWFSLNGNLQITEAHDIAYDSIAGIPITGNQDTGTTEPLFRGSSVWNSVSTADGGDISVDTITLAGNNQSIRYTSFQNLGAFRRRVVDASNNVISTSFPTLTPVGGSPTFDPQFVTPVELNSIAPTRILFGGDNGLYESQNQGSTIRRLSAAITGTSALAYGGSSGGTANQDVIYAGDDSGNIHVRTTATGAFTETDPQANSSQIIQDVKLDPDEWQSAFAIDSNQVFSTIDAGNNWSDITGNLASISDGLYRSLEFIRGPIDAIAVGTNTGVFASLVSSLGVWFSLGGGLPHVPAFDLDHSEDDNVLVVGTLGRGAWSLGDVETLLAPSASVVGRHVAYGNTTASYGEDLVAPDISPLLPGETASTENYTNYTRGLNRVVIDFQNLASDSLADENFEFRVGNTADPSTWSPLTDGGPIGLPSISVTPDFATPTGNVDRVILEWPDGAIRNSWLQVTVEADASTGLSQPDTFYFGNQVADVFGTTSVGNSVVVNSFDTAVIRVNQSVFPNSVGIDNRFDVDRNGSVNSFDSAFSRVNLVPFGGLLIFTAPLAAPPTNDSANGAFAESFISQSQTLNAPSRFPLVVQPVPMQSVAPAVSQQDAAYVNRFRQALELRVRPEWTTEQRQNFFLERLNRVIRRLQYHRELVEARGLQALVTRIEGLELAFAELRDQLSSNLPSNADAVFRLWDRV